MEEVACMTYTAASHERANKIIQLHFSGPFMLLLFTVNNVTKHIYLLCLIVHPGPWGDNSEAPFGFMTDSKNPNLLSSAVLSSSLTGRHWSICQSPWIFHRVEVLQGFRWFDWRTRLGESVWSISIRDEQYSGALGGGGSGSEQKKAQWHTHTQTHTLSHHWNTNEIKR